MVSAKPQSSSEASACPTEDATSSRRANRAESSNTGFTVPGRDPSVRVVERCRQMAGCTDARGSQSLAVIDVPGFVAGLKEHAIDHGFHVHDDRHFVETYSMRQA